MWMRVRGARRDGKGQVQEMSSDGDKNKFEREVCLTIYEDRDKGRGNGSGRGTRSSLKMRVQSCTAEMT